MQSQNYRNKLFRNESNRIIPRGYIFYTWYIVCNSKSTYHIENFKKIKLNIIGVGIERA